MLGEAQRPRPVHSLFEHLSPHPLRVTLLIVFGPKSAELGIVIQHHAIFP